MQLRRSILVCSFLFGSISLLKAQSQTPQQYIAKFKDIAISEMQRSGVPASIKLAQGILETQSGNGWLVQNSNNHFGIKCKNNWTGESVRYDDDARQECFRKYNSAADSYKDHSDFLRNNPRYAFLFQFQEEDYKSWAYGLKQAGYATSSTYPQQLIKLIEDYNLQQYTLEGEGVAKTGSNGSKTGEEMVGYKPVKPATPAPVTTKPAGISVTTAPKGIFQINNRKVIAVPAGTSLIQLANERDIKLRNLVHYNDLDNDNPLRKDSYIFLQKKAKSGKNDYHTVAPGETMYDIAQAEGIQLRWLRRRNKMKEGQEPEVGERLALAGYASKVPRLAKNPPPEDPTIGDLDPGKIMDDVRAEIERERQEEMAMQQADEERRQKEAAAKSNLPAGMMDDLKKLGEVKTQGGTTPATPVATKPATSQPATPAPTTQPPAQPVSSASPQPTGTTPAVPSQTTPATSPSQPVYTSRPDNTTSTGEEPASPVTTNPAPAAGTPAAAPARPVTTPAQPIASQPGSSTGTPADSPSKAGPIREGNSLYHEVQTKETLYSISKKYNVSIEQLRQWNNLETFDIKIGQRLLVGKI
ncbi:glucosaminidase domain-containing protein [Chitinophaga rhizophila]|uniref:Peptidoglycan hydrolase n=1 Tax=Chitinophaga rhizophila TaxID=2866212 RepID=A0ABS7GDJ5_9BACT|nr:glucosaminidase domain-containing protein [Chitinophaga rhizophila]MBW8685411.1 glucosaminidase domain-containing protein [Chitinophaga rhizophila]